MRRLINAKNRAEYQPGNFLVLSFSTWSSRCPADGALLRALLCAPLMPHALVQTLAFSLGEGDETFWVSWAGPGKWWVQSGVKARRACTCPNRSTSCCILTHRPAMLEMMCLKTSVFSTCEHYRCSRCAVAVKSDKFLCFSTFLSCPPMHSGLHSLRVIGGRMWEA